MAKRVNPHGYGVGLWQIGNLGLGIGLHVTYRAGAMIDGNRRGWFRTRTVNPPRRGAAGLRAEHINVVTPRASTRG